MSDETLPVSDICLLAPPAVPLMLSVPTLAASCLVLSSEDIDAAISDNIDDVAVSCSNTMCHAGFLKPFVRAPVRLILASPSVVESEKFSNDILVLVP